MLASLAISKAMTQGYAGVCGALAATQSVWATLLNMIIYSDTP